MEINDSVEHFGNKSENLSDEMEDVAEDDEMGNVMEDVGGKFDQVILDGPKVGMIFSSVSEMFNFYQKHAKLLGFSVVKASTVWNKKDSEERQQISQTIRCYRGRKSTVEEGIGQSSRPSQRINCQDRINASFVNGMWRINNAVSDHYHTISPYTVGAQHASLSNYGHYFYACWSPAC